ncbi:PKD domain-containing protein [Fibrisoma limi BUZ 3]|uniref:PKD domain-containing protein n=1 Tax=Fibrisoma limi BUZ 3 TaxID=1185876 RepID=I2GHR3_9BACT|nr:PKD domain-containing protein [Fibrisoma limi]CCH53438.1 PKD domain-containing protein [Fibrisoma limi BUZ 3]
MALYLNLIRLACVGLGCGLLMSACSYDELPEADYPQQLLYQPTARNGVYTINSLPPATGTYRFSVNLAEKKLIVPLSVFRGGVSTAGDVAVTVSANADTVARLISTNVLPGTVPLPVERFVLPNSLNLGNGMEFAPFDLRIDLDYLRANPGQKLAVGVTISSGQIPVNPALKTTIVSLDPSILKPTPNFTSKADATTPRKIAFANTSANALSYSWDFGDGSAAVTDASPTYTYAKAGTYTVTLTATGITGSQDATQKIMSVVVP